GFPIHDRRHATSQSNQLNQQTNQTNQSNQFNQFNQFNHKTNLTERMEGAPRDVPDGGRVKTLTYRSGLDALPFACAGGERSGSPGTAGILLADTLADGCACFGSKGKGKAVGDGNRGAPKPSASRWTTPVATGRMSVERNFCFCSTNGSRSRWQRHAYRPASFVRARPKQIRRQHGRTGSQRRAAKTDAISNRRGSSSV
ncbi:MAG TPA: hypothetical protein VLT88_05895, partial [Desulfosarcina sp.]|nr:hypothetical protein [Desulfosarcina sp.]